MKTNDPADRKEIVAPIDAQRRRLLSLAVSGSTAHWLLGGSLGPGLAIARGGGDLVYGDGFESAPAWLAALSATDTLYEIGNLPSVLASSIVWPAAGAENVLMNNGGDGNPWRLHYGYGGSVYVPEMGRHGAMVFGSTGEASISNQLTRFALSDDAPGWEWLQQPLYATSLAEAQAMDADWYYNVAEFNALPANKRINTFGEANFSSSWDKTFPVGHANWIARRRHRASVTGYNRPHWFRYGMPRYVPPTMTGTGVGAIVVNQRGTIYGPFSQGPIPAGGLDVDWFESVHGSGRRRHYLYAMNVVTGAWTRLAPNMPDWTGYSGDIVQPFACVDETNRRIYYTTYNGSNWATYYADLSAGLSGITWSGPTNLIDLAGGPAPSQAANAVLCVPRFGALAGKRLWYLREHNNSNLLLIDLDNNTLRRLIVPGLPASSEWWGFGYDWRTNRVYITTKSTITGVKYCRFAIPNDYTNAAAYTPSTQSVALNGITIEAAGTTTWQYGERSLYLDRLGVILMTQRDNRMLAYRPGI